MFYLDSLKSLQNKYLVFVRRRRKKIFSCKITFFCIEERQFWILNKSSIVNNFYINYPLVVKQTKSSRLVIGGPKPNKNKFSFYTYFIVFNLPMFSHSLVTSNQFSTLSIPSKTFNILLLFVLFNLIQATPQLESCSLILK